MPLPQVLLACLVGSCAVLLTRCYEDEIEVNYADPFYNEIAEGAQPESFQPPEATTTPSPLCKSPEFTKWDKLFTMLENSQMKENMLLQYTDSIIKVELQSLRGEMLQFVANYAGGCASAVDSAGRRLAVQLERKLTQATERMKEINAEQLGHQEALLQQLAVAGRAQAARLSRLELACAGVASAGGEQRSDRSVRDAAAAAAEAHLERSLASLASDLQKAQVQLDRSLWAADRHFLPSGCETALLFPMRSARIYAAVTPDASTALSSFTVCLWAKAREALNKTVLFSYGSKKNSPEIQLALSGRSVLFTVGGASHPVEAGEVAADGQWGHFCGTWSSEEGLASLWANGLKVAGASGVATGHVLPEGGTMSLGQEKSGSTNFGFSTSNAADPKLAFAGKMTGVSLWDRVLDEKEIFQNAQQEGSCSSRGNVVGWGVSEIIPHGGAQYIN